MLVLLHHFFAMVESLAKEFWQIVKVLIRLLGSFFDFFLNVSEVSFEVIKLQEALVDQVFLRVIKVVESKRWKAEHLSDNNWLFLLVVRIFAILGDGFRFLFHGFKISWDAFLAKRLALAHVDNGLWEMSLADIWIHEGLLLFEGLVH